jgi:hypothetical protein
MIRRGIGVGSFVAAGGGVSDADAQAFITAAAITDSTQQSAIDTLVVDLKTYGIWTKMKAIYPFVGGTSSTHKWNLKDPRDLDAAFRLVFTGGWTHSSNGALPNGTNGYADSYLIPSTALQLNSVSMSYYSRTSSTTAVQTMGCNDVVNYLLLNNFSGGTSFYSQLNTSGANYIQATITNTQGLFIANRTTSTAVNLWRNSSKVATDSKTSSARPAVKLFIGARNNTGAASNFDNKQLGFASIGDGLTDTEAANLYTAVQAYQTTLSRNV